MMSWSRDVARRTHTSVAVDGCHRRASVPPPRDARIPIAEPAAPADNFARRLPTAPRTAGAGVAAADARETAIYRPLSMVATGRIRHGSSPEARTAERLTSPVTPIYDMPTYGL